MSNYISLFFFFFPSSSFFPLTYSVLPRARFTHDDDQITMRLSDDFNHGLELAQLAFVSDCLLKISLFVEKSHGAKNCQLVLEALQRHGPFILKRNGPLALLARCLVAQNIVRLTLRHQTRGSVHSNAHDGVLFPQGGTNYAAKYCESSEV